MTEWDNDRQKRFWEACGCVQASGVLKRDFHYEFGAKVGDWRWPDGSGCKHGRLPDIHDLNVLFKYAVPKVIELGDSVTILCLPHNSYEVEIQLHNGHPVHYETVSAINRDIALCLAEAIEKVIVKS